ncbi:DUF6461 domain-containing protein [Nonomuraea sp. NPDC003707]
MASPNRAAQRRSGTSVLAGSVTSAPSNTATTDRVRPFVTRATTQDCLWWEEFRSSLGVSGFCFTLVAGLQPAQVLERLAVKPDEPLQAEGYIEVGPARHESWSVL